MAERVSRGGKRYWMKPGARGQASSAPARVPMAKPRIVVVRRRPIVQGERMARMLTTVRG